ncbi:hypothetical protein DVH24_034591 [Malus domestica]|uniref:RNase H type-1 domain-containing protein n=1 Tax=Malus domestica TaxID=3750 RepID=A0A498J2M3_MALDO|nr:hypothetical protein DVH24_034591 [Malus domestica]
MWVLSQEKRCIRDALWIRSRGFKKICVEGVSKLVIDSILGSCNIKGLAASFDSVFWAQVYKEAHFVANAITSTGLQFNNLHVSDRTLPNVIYKAYFFDWIRNDCDRAKLYSEQPNLISNSPSTRFKLKTSHLQVKRNTTRP